MLSKEILNEVRHSSYWERPYTQWTINTWDNFYFINYPNKLKVSSHRDLGKELKVLVELLGPETKEGKKALALKRQLKGRRASRHRASKSGKEDEKENQDITSTKRKAIEKVKPKKKHKTIEKDEREERLPKEDPGEVM
ncbi:10221_t:CDS:2 [Dentiscutata erythropus]|uniref:10221_t:CDS:1 n=1 Tax=Dentiscutata erythropus TaxID=1348616 RepID=A0A9N9DUD3_9GLOM|nr:10221_t:CDS:2 [Dentiscutata erythropus]